MDTDKFPSIFLSYSRNDTATANTIDNDFKSLGITFRRDVRDVDYRESIKEFMQRIGEHEFVVLIISETYLKSYYCMYEVTEVLHTRQFSKKVLPVMLPNASDILKMNSRALYYKYWQQQLTEAQKQNQELQNTDSMNYLKMIQNINQHLDMFFEQVTDMNLKTMEELREANYEPMLKIMGLQNPQLLEQVIAIAKIEDWEEQEIALEAFLASHKDDKFALAQRGYVAAGVGHYKRAKAYYEKLLRLHPDMSTVHYNLAVLLKKSFNDAEGARREYKEVIKLDPLNSNAFNNLGIVLEEDFSDYVGAKEAYLKAIEIDASMFHAYFNLATLQEDKLKDYTGARLNYEKTIELEPKHVKALGRLTLLLMEHFDSREALPYYLRTVEIEPKMRTPEMDIYFELK